MHNFFFNHECLPVCEDHVGFIQLFEITLAAFDSLVSKPELNILAGIVTEKSPSEMQIGPELTLGDVLNGIGTQAMRTLAYKYFTRFPIDDHLEGEDQHDITESEFTEAGNFYWMKGNEERECFYLYLAVTKGGLVFSAPIEEELAAHPLVLQNRAEAVRNIHLPNLYGEEENTRLIEQELRQRNRSSMDLFEQLEDLLESNVIDRQFRKDFESLKDPEKQSIIEHFNRAKNRALLSPFQPDDGIIKETKGNAKCKVYELRVFSPTALRVYFLEENSKVYLASVGLKSSSGQSQDIRKAERIIFKLLLTNP